VNSASGTPISGKVLANHHVDRFDRQLTLLEHKPVLFVTC
jgi:hypothetical protein